MLRKVFQCFVLIAIAFVFTTTSPMPVKNAEASLRHNCGCERIVIEIYDDKPSRRTTWGKLKAKKPRKKYTKKCDIRWHINPFYHTGACD